MPHEVTMPQLGMVQDAGVLVSWLKEPGAAVSKGEALFEVETDKAVMEIEAQASGYLTDVAVAAGAEVPVGAVIARISDSPEGAGAAPDAGGPAAPDAAAPAAPAPDAAPAALPEGHAVRMPQLGMAQDAGILVGWSVAPRARVTQGRGALRGESDKVPTSGRSRRRAAVIWLAVFWRSVRADEVPVGAR